MILVRPVDLVARRTCDDDGHAHPIVVPDGPSHNEAYVEAAKQRLVDGWTTFVCWGCGCGGWRPPAPPAL